MRLLWLDEAWRAVGATGTQSGQILLASEQLFGRIGVALFGYTPLSMRIWPLLFSIAAIYGGFLVARRIASLPSALCVALLLAVGPGFIFHAREFKPYAADLALTLWSIFFALRYVERPNSKAFSILIAALTVFACSSLAFVFVAPAIALFVFRPHTFSQPVTRALPLSIPFLVFGVVYWWMLRPQVLTASTVDYWADYYIQGLADLPRIFRLATSEASSFVLPGWKLAFVSFFVVTPICSLLKRDGIALILNVPFLAQLVAAVAGIYPLFGRPSYYLYGLMCLALGYALHAGSHLSTSTNVKRVYWIVSASALLSLSATQQNRESFKRAVEWPAEQGRKAFSELGIQAPNVQNLYLNYGTYFSFEFHRHDPSLGVAQLIPHTSSWADAIRDSDPDKLCHTVKAAAGERKQGDELWFLSTHVLDAHRRYDRALKRVGRVVTFVGEPRQSLVRVTLEKDMSQLTCAKASSNGGTPSQRGVPLPKQLRTSASRKHETEERFLRKWRGR